MVDYCAVCDEETIHIPYDDDVFEFAIMCIKCNTVWEAGPTPTKDGE